MSAPYFTIAAREESYVALRTPDEELTLVQEYRGDRVPSKFGAQYTAVRLFLAICKSDGIIYNWRDQLLARPASGKAWRQLRTPHEVNYILQSQLRLASRPVGGDDYTALSPGNLQDDASFAEVLRACGLFVHDTIQLDFCYQLLAAIPDFPHVVGFLAHPVAGTPVERWLYPEHP